MKTNSLLGIIALVLLALSLLSYKVSTTRAERFERGQKFLSQLNPDNIHEIDITKSGDTVTLRRGEDRFSVASKNNYPAKNEAINRFLNDVLGIGLEKKVGKGESLAKELEVQSDAEAATHVILKNEAGKTMVDFVLGKSLDGGAGRYLLRLDGEDQAIYLSSGSVTLTTSADGFLDKEILNLSADKLVRIEGGDFTMAKADDGPLTLEGIPSGKQAKTSETSQVTNMLSYLKFDQVYLADHPEVANLNFDKSVRVRLDDQSGYDIALAEKDGKYYMTIEGTFDVGQIQLRQDETEEELKEKSEILSRSDEINKFNALHGSWVYGVSEATAKKFLKTKSELVEDIPKKEEG